MYQTKQTLYQQPENTQLYLFFYMYLNYRCVTSINTLYLYELVPGTRKVHLYMVNLKIEKCYRDIILHCIYCNVHGNTIPCIILY